MGIKEKIKLEAAFVKYCHHNQIRKLQLGCGPNLIKGFFNTDINTTYGGYFVDATQPLPFRKDTFHYIFSEHNFEHFTYHEGKSVLQECYRVLKPGGTLRLTTPNLEFLVDIYNHPNKQEFQDYMKWHFQNYATEQSEDFGEDYSTAFLLNNFLSFWGHKCVYDKATIKRVLLNQGFENIIFHNVSESTHAELCNIEHHQDVIPIAFNAIETMCVEATKPQ